MRYGLGDDCPMLPFLDAPGVCNRCGTKLTGRKTQWCSSECNNSLAREHDWNLARRAARDRDNHRCVKCGEAPKVRRRSERIDPLTFWGRHQLKRIGIEVLHSTEFRTVDVYEWVERLEVNHIKPRVGQGYGFGCHNHLGNLETLCHPCHVKETNRQAAERRGDPPSVLPVPQLELFEVGQ